MNTASIAFANKKDWCPGWDSNPRMEVFADLLENVSN